MLKPGNSTLSGAVQPGPFCAIPHGIGGRERERVSPEKESVREERGEMRGEKMTGKKNAKSLQHKKIQVRRRPQPIV